MPSISARTPPEEFQRALALYQAMHLVKASPVFFLGNPFSLIILGGLVVERATPLEMGLLFGLCILLCLPVLLRWLRLRNAPRPEAVRSFTIGKAVVYSAIMGLFWAGVAQYALPLVKPGLESYFVAVLYVLILAAAASLATIPAAALAYAVPLALSCLIVLLRLLGLEPGPELLTFAGLCAAFGVLLKGGWDSFDQTVRILAERSMLLAEKTEEAERRRRTEEALHQSLARLKDTQQQLVEQEKLASLGQLVAGVAHEINTPVGVALTGATVLRHETRRLRSLAEQGQARKSDVQRYFALADETADLVTANCQRAADLVHSFKQVAVDQASEGRRETVLATFLNEVLFSLRPKLKNSPVAVSVECPADIVMDTFPGCISQVLTNFVMNSLLHAFDPGQSGQITIRALQEGQQVVLTYADDGKGIAPEHQGRIFDPFFTTKRGQGGTGLGMHVVYNLVTGRLGGNLRLESAPGRGTVFILTLPVSAPRSGGMKQDQREPATATGGPVAVDLR